MIWNGVRATGVVALAAFLGAPIRIHADLRNQEKLLRIVAGPVAARGVVHEAVAVPVPTVADFDGAGIDGGVVVVAVPQGAAAEVREEAVSVPVLAALAKSRSDPGHPQREHYEQGRCDTRSLSDQGYPLIP